MQTVIRLTNLIFWLLVIVIAVTILAADGPLPPPVAYTTSAQENKQYYIFDFETGEVETIRRQAGYVRPAADLRREVPFTGPTGVRYLLVNVTDTGSIGYDLYRMNADDTRTLVRENVADHFGRWQWSADERYAYFIADHVGRSPTNALVQFDTHTGQVHELMRDMLAFRGCQPSVWCAVQTTQTAAANVSLDTHSLHALDLNGHHHRGPHAGSRPICIPVREGIRHVDLSVLAVAQTRFAGGRTLQLAQRHADTHRRFAGRALG